MSFPIFRIVNLSYNSNKTFYLFHYFHGSSLLTEENLRRKQIYELFVTLHYTLKEIQNNLAYFFINFL